MKRLSSILLTTVLSLGAPLTVADTLLIDAISSAPINSTDGLPRPHRGQNMNQTRAQFGEPVKEISWIGDPPISRWIYGGFTVYFENNIVITTVVHR